MSNIKITIADIEEAKNIEFHVINEYYAHNTVVFKHGFDGDKTTMRYDNGKCYVDGKELPYPAWTNMLLRFVHFHYSYEIVG